MKYAVFECNDTVALCREARGAGFGSWIPMEVIRRLRQPRNKAPYYEEMYVCAMPGYIYVPYDWHEEFVRWVPEKYRVQLLYIQCGPTGLKKIVAQTMKKPAQVSLEELKRMDSMLRASPKVTSTEPPTAAEPAPEPELAVGQMVTVRAGVFVGLVGKVVQIGKKGFAVSLGARTVWFRAVLLQPDAK